MRTHRTILILLAMLLCGPLLPQGAVAQGWEWGKSNTDAFLDGWPIAVDQWSNVLVATMTEGTGTSPARFGPVLVPFSDAGLGNQCIVTKYDSAGNLRWAVGTQKGDTYLIGLATDQDGDAILFGTINSDSVQIGSVTLKNPISPDPQYFIARLDSAGNVTWAVSGGNSRGMPDSIGAVFGTGAIGTDAAGNIYITTGYYLPAISVGPYTLTNSCANCNTDDMLLAKYDRAGQVVWAKNAGGSVADEAYGLTVTPAGDVYISGVFNSPSITFGPSTLVNTSGGWNAYIARYDSAGNPLWACSSGGAAHGAFNYAVGLASDAASNVYVTGWVSDSSIAYNGTTIVNPYPKQLVLYLAKFDPANNVNWYKTIGSAGSRSFGYAIAISPCAVWVTGTFGEPVNIDGNILDTPADNAYPVFIAGFNFEGKYIGSAALQSGGDDEIGVACDGAGNVYVCSDYERSNPFYVGTETLPAVGQKTENMYVAKYIPVDTMKQDAVATHQDTSVCLYTSQKISAPPGHANYLWDNGSKANARPVSAAGSYWVLGLDGCSIIDTISVTNNNELCGCYPAVPSAFTPNGDGKDDIFGPLFQKDCRISDYSFAVYNRWGQEVFQTTNPTYKWDGHYWADRAETGVYEYLIEYRSGIDNTRYFFKGDVTLLR